MLLDENNDAAPPSAEPNAALNALVTEYTGKVNQYRPASPNDRNVRLLGIWAPAPQSGKTEARKWLIGHYGRNEWGLPVARHASFAYPLRQTLAALIQELSHPDVNPWEYMDNPALKETPIPGVGRSFVELAVKLGTDVGRNWLGEDCWVKPFERNVEYLLNAEHAPLVVCDDVRFRNEAEAIRRLGGKLMGVIRPGATVSAARAAAEGHLSVADMDIVVPNDSTLAIFQERVSAAARKIGVDV